MSNKDTVLILAEDYPRFVGDYRMAYVHSRSRNYIALGKTVNVISFGASDKYELEGVTVWPETAQEAKRLYKSSEIVYSHAPNIRNHARFILANRRLGQIIFVIHGHEVLRKRRYYPKPYSWNRIANPLYQLFDSIYDEIKLIFWHSYFKITCRKSKVGLIFVSAWMLEQFEKNLLIDLSKSNCNYSIIPNAIHKEFLDYTYNPNKVLHYDFITVRPLDGSKYAIDLVLELARCNPDKKFLVIGKGNYFHHVKKPENVEWLNKFVGPEECIKFLNRSRAGLMPTRLDSQGVTMCEMATFGIPMYVSDMPICREMLKDFNNVQYISNDAFSTRIIPQKVKPGSVKSKRFDGASLAIKELQMGNIKAVN